MEDKKFCKFCGEKIDKESIVCPMCGRQLQVVKKTEKKENEKTIETKKEKETKFYEQQWFMWVMLVLFAPVGIIFMWKFNDTLKQKTKIILSVVFGIFFLIMMFSGNTENKKIEWNDIELKEKLPMPETLTGEITSNRSDLVMVDIINISKEEYKAYIEECRDKGYTIDLEFEPWDTVYGAFDKDGYSLRISYLEYSEEMSITLESPETEKMKEIEWPTNGLGAMLPTPKSTFGEISWNNSDTFIVHIGNMTIDDYNDYVKTCESKGFTNDYSKSDKSYSATNSQGYELHLMYLGANVIEISLKTSQEDQEKEVEDTNEKETTNSKKELSDDFKKAMNEYEEFMDEYISFMKKYKKSNGTDTSLLKDYTKYISEYADMVSSFQKWESKDLNTEEAKYYLEVQTRVSKKLIDASLE